MKILIKMVSRCTYNIQEDEISAEELQKHHGVYDKSDKGY